MGLPGGGRTLPSQRLLRHFNLVHVPPYSQDNLKRIFSTILNWGFQEHDQSWRGAINNLVELTIDVYERAVKNLLPLPMKSHYLFNLRQVSEVIQGLVSVQGESVSMMSDKLPTLKRLWVHECLRVFSDRLINQDDKLLFIRECLTAACQGSDK